MASISSILGLNTVLANMKARQAQILQRAGDGLYLAGLHLQADSQEHVPVEFGPLKASAYTKRTGAGAATQVDVGYTAAYALYVHEKVAMKLKGQPRPSGQGMFWDPQGRAYAKFLEEPMRRLMPTLNRIVANAAKLP